MGQGIGRIYCHNCQSRNVKPTSSEQMRQVGKRKRLTADMICNKCGHTWWSVHPDALKMAREMDQKRVETHESNV